MTSFTMIFKLAIATLWLNRFRSFLTLLGMLFGTAAVIATLSSNEGAQRFLAKQLDSLGSNVITISSEPLAITEHDVAIVKEYIPAIDLVAIERTAGEVYFEREKRSMGSVTYGVGASYFSANRIAIERGRTFTNDESSAQAAVVILGAKLKETLFGVAPATGEYIFARIDQKKYALQVIGVAKEKGGATGSLIDGSAYISEPLLQKLFPAAGPGRIMTTLNDEKASSMSSRQMLAFFLPKFGEGLRIADSREALEKTQAIWAKQNFVGICLAVVSLLTGGVGIMNIMLLSIHQRLREIGLRKAVGAQNIEVAAQFLLEAIIICLVGGGLGVLAGWGFGQQVARMLGEWEAVTSVNAILVALGFSVLTGIVFGLFPALRASRVDPYDALRSN